MKKKIFSPTIWRNLLSALLCISVLANAAGCGSLASIGVPATSAETALVDDMLQQRAAALNQHDLDAYMGTVLPSDAELMKEETNLLLSLHRDADLALKLNFARLRNIDGKNFCARLTQTYQDTEGQDRGCSYDALFVLSDGKAYYAGPVEEDKQNGSARVLCPPGWDDAGQAVLDMETDILDSFRQELGFQAQKSPVIKLYDDQEVFRQSIKLDLPAWVGGWHENGESIKLLVSETQSRHPDAFLNTLRHETTHLMVSQLSGDNAAYWLQEGLAGAFEQGFDGLKSGHFDLPAGDLVPFEQQRDTDLEAMDVSDVHAVNAYYNSSYDYTAFLLETYGWQKVREMLRYLGNQPGEDVVSREKLNYCNDLTDEAMKNIIGISPDEIDAKCREWLSSR